MITILTFCFAEVDLVKQTTLGLTTTFIREVLSKARFDEVLGSVLARSLVKEEVARRPTSLARPAQPWTQEGEAVPSVPTKRGHTTYFTNAARSSQRHAHVAQAGAAWGLW